jgi:uncharacterized protein (TIGR00725 family)
MHAKQRTFQVAMIGDSDAAPAALTAAEAIGVFLAENGIALITGGHGGVMEAAARGAVSRGGLTIGILPDTGFGGANPWCRIVLPTGLGHARNVLCALAGDLVIAIGGGAGTLSELAFAWLHGRPILALAGHDGWVDRLGETPIDARETSRLVRCASARQLQDTVLAARDLARDASR